MLESGNHTDAIKRVRHIDNLNYVGVLSNSLVIYPMGECPYSVTQDKCIKDGFHNIKHT